MVQATAKTSGRNVRKPDVSGPTPWARRTSTSKASVLLLYNLDRTWSEPDLQEVLTAVEKLESALIEAGHPMTSRAVHRDVEAVIRDFDPSQDIIFNWCDGLEGAPKAEHLVPWVLEALGFSYTGADAQTLLISQDKWRVKRILHTRHISTPRGRVFRQPEADGWDHFPAIVKPVAEHCSFGITREAVVDTPQDLERRVAYVLETFNQPALVEDFIDGREFHVAVWGNGRPQVLPLAEMDFSAFGDVHDRLCTYESKWEPGSLPYRLIRTLCPAPVDGGLKARIETVAVTAYRALGCRDYGRMDIRVRDGVSYVLDVNPNPDICDDGSFALAAEVAGFSYPDMASHIVALAANRSRFT
ncbi:MAG: ATP-grasp domain-containing protein [Chloroflexi bacterium]|nr:ATP-grasp domain-containing protein [Chloroflexota bacterium]